MAVRRRALLSILWCVLLLLSAMPQIQFPLSPNTALAADDPAPTEESTVETVAFSPDGETLATGDDDGDVVLWSVDDGTERQTLTGHEEGTVTGLAFSPDGQTLVSGGRDTSVRLWDLPRGQQRKVLRGQAQPVRNVALSPDGSLIASVGEDTRILLWDAAKGTLLREMRGHTDFVNVAAFSPDGKTLATGSDDGRIILWDPSTGRQKGVLLGHSGGVNAIAFNGDGTLLASGGTDTILRIWDVATGRQRQALHGHTDPIQSVAFTHPGRAPLLVSGGADGQTILWNLASGRQRQALRGHARGVRAVALSPDGKTVASAGEDGATILFDADTGRQNRVLKGKRKGRPATTSATDNGAEDGTVEARATLAATGLTDGPGGPILLIRNPGNPYSGYYAEILRNEGFNAFSAMDLSSVTASVLNTHQTVILAETSLTSSQVTMFSNWVNAGGKLIAMRPDKQLASLLGLNATTSTLSNGYLKVNTNTAPGNGIVGETIQFHGTADRYSLNGATSVATLYSSASTATNNPAVTLRSVGGNGGQAAAFTYDLARSIVYSRQGNPAWSGQQRSGLTPIRSHDLYYGASAQDPQEDWVDLTKVLIPQADEQQRLLANLIIEMNRNKMPMARFWYFPFGKKAVIVMTGDDHGNNGTTGRFNQFLAASPPGCSVEDWECVRGTSYIFPNTPISPQQAAAFNAQGFEIGLHVNTNCQDFTAASLNNTMTVQLQDWRGNFSSLPSPTTNRTHCIAWSDWVTQAKVSLAHGIRLDTNYYYWPPSWVMDRPGFFTGSGMPMRFADVDGTLIDVYQATSQMTDESGQSFPFTVDVLLDKALGPEGYYGAFTINAHTDVPGSWEADTTVASALARGVPIVSAKQLLTWLDGRNNSSIGGFNWNGSQLNFTVSPGSGARGLQAMLPTGGNGNTVLQGLTRNGNTVNYSTQVIKGVEYAVFDANAGSYVATYGADTTAPNVTGTSPENGALEVSIGTTVRATFNKAIDPATVNTATFELRDPSNTLVPASVSYDSATRTAILTPNVPLSGGTSYTARVKGGTTDPRIKDAAGNALQADYTWSFTTQAPLSCPCSLWPNNPTPAIVTQVDPNPVELGVKFTAETSGFITGIRFFKGPQNTGTHVGSLWTANGQLLARATFTNESASGWQQVNFASPVAIEANTTYVASYHTQVGMYSATNGYFSTSGVDTGPLHAPSSGSSGGNGVYTYSSSSTFPTSTHEATNYWVDVIFTSQGTPPVDTTSPTVTSTAPANNATNVSINTTIRATFSEPIDPATVNTSTMELRDANNALVPASVSYQGATRTVILTPNAPLANGAQYTARVRGGGSDPRIKDLAGNALAADHTWSFTTQAQTGDDCPCSLWPNDPTPELLTDPDTVPVELGVKFSATADGFITGLRFYKGPQNTGTHVGSLWTANGQLLARATFTNETASGWQSVSFDSPVPITANTVYVASYHAPNGRYSKNANYFANQGVVSGPLRAPADGVSGANGVYAYASTSTFPTDTYQASNYWVDVIFTESSGPDTTPPTITGTSPNDGATGVAVTTTVRATFNEPLDPATVTANTMELRGPGNTLVPASVSYDATNRAAELTPSAPLAGNTQYTVRIRGGATDPRIKDLAGNALAADHTWSFTTQAQAGDGCPCSLWPNDPTPATITDPDTVPVELGVKFRATTDGFITGLRFYKGPQNTGTHVGSLWTANGQLLARATFANETASGWQQVTFDNPVPITANTVYVASYHAPNGHYSEDTDYFADQGVVSGPLQALQSGISGPNGVYAYASSSTFPTESYRSSNYWVDVVFTTSVEPDTTPPTVTSSEPARDASDVPTNVVVQARFSEALHPSTVNTDTVMLSNSNGAVVPATVSYDTLERAVVLTPTTSLAEHTRYTVRLRGGNTDPRIKDLSGNALAADFTWSFTTGDDPCASAPNPIAAENCLPGNPPSEWDINGSGDPSIQGFATDISVNRGQTIAFKIRTNASAYRLDIYRLGYYDGLGARKVATVQPSANLPQSQPNCLTQSSTGLIDCGNWAVSATWAVPANATSGIYIAKLVRSDTGGASHIVFIVRDDSSHSDILFQTSDTTWQAYNTFGGNSLYTGSPAGRAYKVSYNRPFNTRSVDNGQDWLFHAEYPMVRWLEANGYDVTYFTGVDSDRYGHLIKNHKIFLSVGHDEYWSGNQRSQVEAARDAGVNLAFLSGNEVFWKTRWENSIDGSGTSYRTLVSYKETHANQKIDPSPEWTGTWRDPRFSPPSDGGRPENALTGTIFMVNAGATTAIRVPEADGKMRFWRHTSVATQAPGSTVTLASSTLGYEWDVDADNGWRPPGLVRLSRTTVSNAPVLLDHGSTYGAGTATHSLTLYRASSGALVFGAGTVQWSWGLDSMHDNGGPAPDQRMRQATVNLLADMGAQPTTLQSGLVKTTASTDTTAPASTITAPSSGASVPVNTTIMISGTAQDTGGVVGGVEVSTDGGQTWHPANGRSSWSYTWRPTRSGTVTILSRAVDDSGNLGAPSSGVTISVGSGGATATSEVETSVDSDAVLEPAATGTPGLGME